MGRTHLNGPEDIDTEQLIQPENQAKSDSLVSFQAIHNNV